MAAPGVVPASRVAMDTSSLLIAFGPPLTFKAPVPKLIISDEFKCTSNDNLFKKMFPKLSDDLVILRKSAFSSLVPFILCFLK